MTNKPVIAMNAEFRPDRAESPSLSWIEHRYADRIAVSEGIPTIIPPCLEDDDIARLLDGVDGFLLTGSVSDLDPKRMGMEPHPATRPVASQREDFDRRLCRMLVDLRIPTLAIGYGMQLMNVVCGGTLVQHIPEDLPRALEHRDRVEEKLRHVLEIVPGTNVHDIYGPGEIRVNSHHHMAVDQIASLFRVSATCPDGVVEAYESMEDEWFCLGVQWHPESETSSQLDIQVFEHFVKACSVAAEQRNTLRFPDRQAA